jgi:hypothetical protein
VQKNGSAKTVTVVRSTAPWSTVRLKKASQFHPVWKRAMLLRMSVFTHFHTDPSKDKSETLEGLVTSHASISHLNFFGL